MRRKAGYQASSGCDTCDIRDTGRAAGAWVAVVAEVAGASLAISASVVRASIHTARALRDCPDLGPRSALHHGSSQ